MTEYKVKKINLKNCYDMDEYQKRAQNASVHFCKGQKELIEYCGGKLKKERCGYCGIIGDIEYIAEKV